MCIAVGILIVSGLAACGGGGGGDHELTGVIRVEFAGSAYARSYYVNKLSPTDCSGGFLGSLADVRQGAEVTVADAAGKVIAVSSLGAGKNDLGLRVCTFSFSVSQVPSVSFYKVDVAHYGTQTFSQAQMTTAGWKIALTAGSHTD